MQDRGQCWTARGKARLCMPLAAEKAVGDSWEVRGPTGPVVWTARIEEGRADLKAGKSATELGQSPS